jgi:hypothetical protein
MVDASTQTDVDASTQTERQVPDDELRDPKPFRSLAHGMAEDDNLVIFRRFQDLNLINLLVIHDELQKLYQKFKENCSKEDEASATFQAAYYLGMTATPPAQETDEDRKIRQDLFARVRSKLKEYSASSSVKYFLVIR